MFFSSVVCLYLLNLADRIKSAWIITTEHRLATILHPKLKNFESCDEEKASAMSVLELQFDKYQSNNLTSSVISSNSTQISSLCSPKMNIDNPKSKSKNVLAQCFDSTIKKNNCEVLDRRQEINDYLTSELPSNYNDDFNEGYDIDVLLYWKGKQYQFPVLSSLAKDIYAIPASNTVIERLFSASKNTVSEKRTSLGSERINQLLFLQKNFTTLKGLFNANRRKRTVSMSSITTVSSEDSTCTTPKQARIDEEDNYDASEDIEIFLD
jgi:hypothetical protein